MPVVSFLAQIDLIILQSLKRDRSFSTFWVTFYLNQIVIWSSGCPKQCEQIMRIWKFLVTNFLSNIAQKFINFKGYVKKHHFKLNLFFGNFWQNLRYFLFQHLFPLGVRSDCATTTSLHTSQFICNHFRIFSLPPYIDVYSSI